MRKITFVDFFGNNEPNPSWNLDFIPRVGERIRVGLTTRVVSSVEYILDESFDEYKIKVYTTNM